MLHCEMLLVRNNMDFILSVYYCYPHSYYIYIVPRYLGVTAPGWLHGVNKTYCIALVPLPGGCRIPLAHGVTGAPRGSRWRHLAQRANETPAPLEAVRRVAKTSHSGCAVSGGMGCWPGAALGRRLRSSAAILLDAASKCPVRSNGRCWLAAL